MASTGRPGTPLGGASRTSGHSSQDRSGDSILEDKFQGLNLHGEEEEELDLSGEVEEIIAENRWIAVFRVHTQKPFSHVSLFKTLRNAWAAAQGVIFKPMGPNLFLAQFMCLGDWNRVMGGGPWIFRNAAVPMEEYDGISDVRQYKLDRIPAWARIMGIPDGLMKKKSVAEKIAGKVGIPPFRVVVNEGRLNPSKYLRARVYLKLDTPLVRFVPLTLKESKRYPVEYEKLPDFCDFCGLMGHLVTECGDGIHDPGECEWGEWLLVNFEEQKDRGAASRGAPRGTAGSDTNKRGDRNNGKPGDANPNEQESMDVGEENSQLGNTVTLSARKRLISQDGKINSKADPAATPPAGFVTDKVLLLENTSEEQIDKSQMSTPQKIHDHKRLKAVVSEAMSNTSASSSGEERRTQ